MTTSTKQDAPVRLRFTPWSNFGVTKLRISRGHREALIEDIKAAGGEAHRAEEFSSFPALEVVGFVVATPAAWAILNKALELFAKRNQGKKFVLELGDQKHEYSDISARDFRANIKAVQKLYEAAEKDARERWDRMDRQSRSGQ